MEPGPGKAVWTYDDLRAMPPDGNRYEIVDGELLVTPAPTLTHQAIVRRLIVILSRELQDTGIAEIFPAPADVILSSLRVVEPDLVVVKTSRADILKDRGVEGVPDLVIEILSPTTARRDRGVKQRLYGKVGVPEYWIVDPVARTVEVLVAAPEGMRVVATYGAGGRLHSEVFELAIEVERIFVG